MSNWCPKEDEGLVDWIASDIDSNSESDCAVGKRWGHLKVDLLNAVILGNNK